MTAEPSVTPKWLESNKDLRELTEAHHAALLRNISKRTATENGSPKQRTRVEEILTLSSSPTVSKQVPEPEREPEPSPKKPYFGPCTYTFNRDKLPGVLARAREYVKKWHKPKQPTSSFEENRRKIREKCHAFTINHSRADKDYAQPTSALYISMEFRKSLIRHDWASAKKLLKVLLRSPFREDRITWKMILTTLYYYPGAEAALREYIERNRSLFGASDIRRGLLEINGMEPYTFKTSSRFQQEDSMSAAVSAGRDDGKKKKKKSKKKKKKDDDEVEIVISDEGSN